METRTPITFEEAKADLLKQIHQEEQSGIAINNTNSKMSFEEDYRILLGEGIEYPTSGGAKIIVPPLKIFEIKMVNDIGKINLDKTLDHIAKLDKIIGALATVLKVDQKLLEENCDAHDLEQIVALLTFSIAKGREMFKKKQVTALEMSVLRKMQKDQSRTFTSI